MFFMNPSSDIIEFTLYPVNFFSSDLAPCLASLSTMLTSLSLVLSFFFAILFSFSSMFSLRIRLIALFFHLLFLQYVPISDLSLWLFYPVQLACFLFLQGLTCIPFFHRYQFFLHQVPHTGLDLS